jgi:mRNA interferase MazF
VKRGEIWWATVDKPRPVCLVSRDEAYEVRALVISAPISTTIRGYAVEVKVGKREGLSHTSVINCDWLVTLPRARLERRLGVLSPAKLEQLDQSLRFALGLE